MIQFFLFYVVYSIEFNKFCSLFRIEFQLFIFVLVHECMYGWRGGLIIWKYYQLSPITKVWVGLWVRGLKKFSTYSVSLSAVGQFCQDGFLVVLVFFLFVSTYPNYNANTTKINYTHFLWCWPPTLAWLLCMQHNTINHAAQYYSTQNLNMT